jgi:hypothetical protein
MIRGKPEPPAHRAEQTAIDRYLVAWRRWLDHRALISRYGTAPSSGVPPVSGGHPQARKCLRRTPTVRTPPPGTNRPDSDRPGTDLRTPTAVPEAAADSHGASTASGAAATQPAAAVSTAGRLRQDRGGPAATTPAPRQRAHVAVARLRGQLTRPAGTGGPDARTRRPPAGHRERARPRHRGYRDRRRACGHCGSGHAGQPSSRTVHHRSHVQSLTGTDRNVRHGQHPRLTARSVAWCSASIWSAPGGFGSAQVGWVVDPVGSRRVLLDRLDDQRMIKGHPTQESDAKASGIGLITPDRGS